MKISLHVLLQLLESETHRELVDIAEETKLPHPQPEQLSFRVLREKLVSHIEPITDFAGTQLNLFVDENNEILLGGLS